MTNLNIAPAPQATPGRRLVPATIKFFDQIARTVWIECPDWCTDDHVENAQLAVEDIIHSSDTTDLGIGTLENERLVFELHAQIRTEPDDRDPRLRQAHIVVDEGGEDALLTPDMADNLADRMIAFAAQIRQLSRTARTHQQGVTA